MAKTMPSSATCVLMITNSGRSTSALTILCSSLEIGISLGSGNGNTSPPRACGQHLLSGLSFGWGFAVARYQLENVTFYY